MLARFGPSCQSASNKQLCNHWPSCLMLTPADCSRRAYLCWLMRGEAMEKGQRYRRSEQKLPLTVNGKIQPMTRTECPAKSLSPKPCRQSPGAQGLAPLVLQPC